MNINLTKYGSGFPVVLFHGWGFDSQIWMSLCSELIQEFQVILVDLPGFGQSKLLEWPSFKEELLCQLPTKFALAGWSMGGLYASRLALEASERVTHLLNITSSPRFLTAPNWPGVTRELFTQFHNNLSRTPQTTLHEFVALHNRHGKPIQLGKLPSKAGLASGLAILDNWDLREALNALQIPVSYIFGRLDPIVPIETMRVMQELYPQFHYQFFKHAAHMPFLSHPELFLAHFKEFIQ